VGLAALHHVDESETAPVVVDRSDELFKDEVQFTSTSLTGKPSDTSTNVEVDEDDGYMTDDQTVFPSTKGYSIKKSAGGLGGSSRLGDEDNFFSDDSERLEALLESNDENRQAADELTGELDNHYLSDIYSGKTDFNFAMTSFDRENLMHDSKIMRKSKNKIIPPPSQAVRRSSSEFTTEEISIANIYTSNKTGGFFTGYNIFSKEKDITGFSSL
jgi:hypothetical protein